MGSAPAALPCSSYHWAYCFLYSSHCLCASGSVSITFDDELEVVVSASALLLELIMSFALDSAAAGIAAEVEVSDVARVAVVAVKADALGLGVPSGGDHAP